jgi:hypothetical protein
MKQPFINSPATGVTAFYVSSDDYIKIVPEFGTGNTIAGVSDVQVWCGLSGINGSSRMNVFSVDPEIGCVVLDKNPDIGSSLTISYASSSIPSLDIEDSRKRSESSINQRLSLCYNLPLNPVPSMIENMATRLASAFLLMRAYGTGSQDTASDGYKLYEQLMGNGDNIGEISLICSANYQIVDDSGNIIPRNDDGANDQSNTYISGGRTRGRLYDITEEPFRFKPYQQDVNTDQPGSYSSDIQRTQG